MSGSQSALLGAGGRWVTNPKHLPLVSVIQTALNVKELITTKTLASVAGFYTAIAKEGASAAITVADTYVTVCNLTGAGFLFNCVSPTHSAGFRPTIRITVDGTVYTITPSADQTAAWRLVLGPTTSGISITGVSAASVAGDIIAPNNSWDSGFTNARIGGVVQHGGSAADFLGIPTPAAIMRHGLPMLRFESSLLVEMKCNLLSGTANDKNCAATYLLDL